MLKPVLLVLALLGGIIFALKAGTYGELVRLTSTSAAAVGIVLGAALTLYAAGRELRSQELETPSPKFKDWLRLGCMPAVFLFVFANAFGLVIFTVRQALT